MEGETAQLVGKPAPSFLLRSIYGAEWRLPKDKSVVVLYFFATWALPSHFEHEPLLKLLSNYESKNIDVAAISVGENGDTVRGFATARQYLHTILLDPESKVSADYGVSSVPTVVLIGKDGTVQTVHVGNTLEVREALQREIDHLLDGKLLTK
jgi:peroxiredoxin